MSDVSFTALPVPLVPREGASHATRTWKRLEFRQSVVPSGVHPLTTEFPVTSTATVKFRDVTTVSVPACWPSVVGVNRTVNEIVAPAGTTRGVAGGATRLKPVPESEIELTVIAETSVF